MKIPALQPGAFMLIQALQDPVRVNRVRDNNIFYLVNDNEFAISKNKLRWVEAGYINAVEIKKLWVEIYQGDLISLDAPPPPAPPEGP
jgi:hypothetical protein